MLALLSLMAALQAEDLNERLGVAANWSPIFMEDGGNAAFFEDPRTFAPFAQYKTGWFLNRSSDGDQVTFYARAICGSRLISTPTVITRAAGESDGTRESFPADMPVEPGTYHELMFDSLCG